ncbi:MAG: aspartyl protease family protein [Labilithrix sp.]|nr:aspartyl protease family protein [Labilithrix sp.]
MQPWRSPLTFVVAAALACGPGAARVPAAPAARPPASSTETIPLRYDRHLPSLAVRIDGELDARFAFDTGIGINLISKSLCKMLSCASAGRYVGTRMSGQEITVPLARVRSLAVGHEEQRDVVVGVLDLEDFVESSDVQGFVSLDFFRRRAFTLDERRSELVLEDAASLDRRVAGGVAVPIEVRSAGEAVTVFLPLEVGGQPALAEVDTGSDALILDERFLASLGVDRSAAKVVEGRDEAGHAFTRWFAEVNADVHPAGAPAIRQAGMRTMFQKIIHDGLVGRRFLEPWAVTFDLPRQRMVFARSAP